MRICTPKVLNCDHCYTQQVAYSDIMYVAVGLFPLATYYLWVTDKFGNQYRDLVTIEDDSTMAINLSNYPEGLFNPSNGSFDIFLSTDIDGIDVVQMIFPTSSIYISFFCLKLSTFCHETGIGNDAIGTTTIL